LFEARSPATHATERDASAAEIGIDLDSLVKKALEARKTVAIDR
jgi:hypothetical protein